MLRFSTYLRHIQIIAQLLCAIVLVTGAFFLDPVTHKVHAANHTSYAKNIPHSRIVPKDAPDVQCLDVQFSNVTGQTTVAVSSPAPGGAVRYTVYLYVVNECATGHRVSNITIVGKVQGSCPKGVGDATDITFPVPYILAPGGGYGKEYSVTSGCTVYTNGRPTASVIPTFLNVLVFASGNYIDGQTGQDATSNQITLPVWPIA